MDPVVQAPVHADRGIGCCHGWVHTEAAEVLHRWAEDFDTCRWDQAEGLGGTYFRIDSRMKAYFPGRKVDGFAREELLKKRTLSGSDGKVVADHPLRRQDPCDLGRKIAWDPDRS